ncbi:SMI1/KNR4 family protein [Streptomyces sp. NPDC059989]|uniref:SMI1/KNR4 family protein n=1 Tax=Streptomyces sp. NPDC059989 TaxID=3347026 RepID=UPI0036B5ED2A
MLAPAFRKSVCHIDALLRLCPPPPPGSPTPVDWDAVEAALGMRLPADYQRLADAYGPGGYFGYLCVYHPAAVGEFTELTGPMPARIRAHLQRDWDDGRHPVPYDPRHLFAIGVTDNGEYLFWITDSQDAPDTWRIAVNEARGPRWFTYDGTLTEFLAGVRSGRTTVPQFPGDLPDGDTGFTPSEPLPYRPAQIPTGPMDTDHIREWARTHGYEVPGDSPATAEDHEWGVGVDCLFTEAGLAVWRSGWGGAWAGRLHFDCPL